MVLWMFIIFRIPLKPYVEKSLTSEELTFSTNLFYNGNIILTDENIYCLNDGSLSIVDINDFSVLGTIYNLNKLDPDNNYPPPIVKNGNYIFCGNFNILDISNPSSIIKVYSTDILPIHDMKVSEDNVFIVNESGLIIMDCSIPEAPVVTGRIGNLATRKQFIEIKDDTAYIANWGTGLIGVVDIGDINNPVFIRELKTKNNNSSQAIYSMIIYNNSLYTAVYPQHIGGVFYLAEYSLDNPGNPYITHQFNLETMAVRDMAMTDNYLFLAADEKILIFDHQK